MNTYGADREQPNIGQIIELRRKGCYLSKRKLAVLAGVDRKTLDLIERGERSPHKSTIQLIMMALAEEESRIAMLKMELGML